MIKLVSRSGCIALTIAGGLWVTGVARAQDEKPPTTVDASKGGFTIKSGDNSITFGGYAQALFDASDRELYDADTAGTGVGVEDGTSTAFSVRRARLELKGTMFRPWLKYAITYELSSTSGDKDSKFKDVYFAFAKHEAATVQIGQFKVPFSLQELTSDTRLQFVDRSITNDFAPARDAGFAVTGLVADGRFGYAAGVFNGGGESKSQDDQGLLYVGRVWVDPLGAYKLGEGTTDAGDEHEVHVGLAYRTGEVIRGTLTTGVFEDPNDQSAWNVEAAWRWKRLFATAEFFGQTNEISNPVSGPDVEQKGWHVQAAVAAIPGTLEFGARYAVLDGNTGADDAAATETRFGVNYYLKGHNFKIQTDYVLLDFEPNAPGRSSSSRLAAAAGRDVTDRAIRVQAQLAF